MDEKEQVRSASDRLQMQMSTSLTFERAVSAIEKNQIECSRAIGQLKNAMRGTEYYHKYYSEIIKLGKDVYHSIDSAMGRLEIIANEIWSDAEKESDKTGVAGDEPYLNLLYAIAADQATDYIEAMRWIVGQGNNKRVKSFSKYNSARRQSLAKRFWNGYEYFEGTSYGYQIAKTYSIDWLRAMHLVCVELGKQEPKLVNTIMEQMKRKKKK